MPAHEETRILPFTAEEMFAIVADVERYPEFVPGCVALRVLSREPKSGTERLTAEMVVAYQSLREKYTSLVMLDQKRGVIEAHHLTGPFDHLDTVWRFVSRGEGSEVHFKTDFAFRSRILSAVAGLVFERVARKMTDAFVARAAFVYGASHHAQQ